MKWIQNAIEFVIANKQEMLSGAAYIIAGASILIKIIPTLSKNNKILPIIKFIGKYLALDKYGPDGKE